MAPVAGAVLRAYRGSMTGEDDEFPWRPRGVETAAHGDPGRSGDRRGDVQAGLPAQPGLGLRGPRWIVSIRALVVVLAMLAAALGVLWLEAASVQGVSAELSNKAGTRVTVPPLEGDATASGTSAAAPPAAPATMPAAPVVAGAGAGNPGEGKSDTGGVLVHVVGAVNNPGVFRLGEGSRIHQAVEAAGGAAPTAQLAALNMAAPVSDGMQIVVPTQEQAARPKDFPAVGAPVDGAPADGAPAQSMTSAPVNINAATAADLDALPGIGPVLAQRIVDWRTDHGPFSSVDALDAVSGIGAKVLENLRNLVSVS